MGHNFNRLLIGKQTETSQDIKYPLSTKFNKDISVWITLIILVCLIIYIFSDTEKKIQIQFPNNDVNLILKFNSTE